jgi:hypothetical protein
MKRKNKKSDPETTERKEDSIPLYWDNPENDEFLNAPHNPTDVVKIPKVKSSHNEES